jgi:restriction system protein
MSRHRSFVSTLFKVGKAVARAERAAQRHRAAADRQTAAAERRRDAAVNKAERERARHLREAAALTREQQREAERQHVRQQEQEVENLNAALAQQVEALKSLLSDGVRNAGPLDFASLKRKPDPLPFEPGKLAIPEHEPTIDRYVPPPLSGLQRLMPGAKRTHEEATELALKAFERDLAACRQREEARTKALAAARTAHGEEVMKRQSEADEWNGQVDQFAADFANGSPSSITDYFRLVLEESDYPEDFPAAMRVAYVAESKQLVIAYECPTLDSVPEDSGYKYVKNKDEIASTARPAGQRRTSYASVIAQITLRTLHEVFRADARTYADTVVFNGHVTAIDKGTGQEVHPCIVTVRTSRDLLAKINLAQVDPLACLKTLSASVSPSPSELVPVRPVLEFSMVDPRFIDEADVLSTLDQRPNLMELSPSEFESLITNLFEKMGLETRQTQASRDGGVDCVAWDNRPIFGGKVAGKTVQEHGWRQRRARPVRHRAERRRFKGHPRHDERLRKGFDGIRQRQAARTPERKQSALSAGNACGHQGEDRGARDVEGPDLGHPGCCS